MANALKLRPEHHTIYPAKCFNTRGVNAAVAPRTSEFPASVWTGPGSAPAVPSLDIFAKHVLIYRRESSTATGYSNGHANFELKHSAHVTDPDSGPAHD